MANTPILSPMAKVPIKEALEFRTDTRRMIDGREELVALRAKARMSLSYTIPANTEASSLLWGSTNRAIRYYWQIPFWHEAQYGVEIDYNFIKCNTQDFRYLIGDKVLINKFDFEISEVMPDGVRVIGVPTILRKNYIAPLYLGEINGDVKRSNNGYQSEYKFELDILNPPSWRNDAPVQEYKGSPIYLTPPVNDGELDGYAHRKGDVVDFGVGAFTTISLYNRTYHSQKYNIVLDGMKEVRAFREFFYLCQGKSRAFWLPSHQIDISYKWPFEAQEDVCIWFKDGTSEIHPKGLVTPSRPNEDILRANYLLLSRFDTDRVEFDWVGDYCATSSFNILSESLDPFFTPPLGNT